MKKLFSCLLALALTLPLLTASADSVTVRIKAMRCEDCAHKVNTALSSKPGIESLDFNLERRTVTVEYNPALTCTDSIYAALKSTRRYMPSEYNPKEVIRRGMGLKVEEMKTSEDSLCIMEGLGNEVGIDSIGPNMAKGYIFVRYDANRTDRATICQHLEDLGFTPVAYYTSPVISHAYFKIPPALCTEDTVEQVLTIDGVDDANVNEHLGSLAITFVNTTTTREKLEKEISKIKNKE